ncbi:MAG: 30S ribosome-binding factor RbfA [Betaproteobacteria bacterium]|jgi:ribosome-binding factor A|nr:30S ribosome-binding factor RbfA [Betaproteobacteria bacterium]
MPRPSGRSQKVGDQIQRELSEIIHRELRDPGVGMITLTGVDVSPDCAYATVYFTCLDAAHVKVAKAGLQRANGFLRAQIGKRIKIWTTPELKFVYDESVERGDRLSRLIDSAISTNTTDPDESGKP